MTDWDNVRNTLVEDRTALRGVITQLEQELDNLKTVLHGNQDADYDKQLQIETLKAQLAEAEADADRLAKELHDWLVFAEANDQIYAARSGMNAMLHHQKRKEVK
jgi:predicted  nucleic acid-binding Zn-ribbon protein